MVPLSVPAEPDVELLQAAAAGEPEAVRRLLDETGDLLYGFVFARVGGDRQAAEDVVQDVYLEAMRSAASYRGDAAVSTWLCAIARRRLGRHYERERRQAAAERGLQLVKAEDGDPGPDHAVEERDEIVRALGRLPALHRQVLVLKYLDGQAVAEIAEALGRSRVQVQSLLQRAREGLRHELGSAGA